ncbi:MAG: fumarylacetoacetase [Candidatus Eremiobacteraeota bacterium]|nr:fumarylacetoacetase [Candidatus Eremiobacteraeota bacterium]
MVVVDPALESWVTVPPDSGFPIQNLPYGVFSHDGLAQRRIGVAIGDNVLDLYALSERGFFDGTIEQSFLQAESLNALLSLRRENWDAVRHRLVSLLRADNAEIRRGVGDVAEVLLDRSAVRMHLPVHVGDYVDFYSSLEHATNLGKIFRPDGEPLMPNWRWLPIGYHGRSSTIVVDGTPVVRPKGQRKPPDAQQPVFGPTQLLDIELEMGFITGNGNVMGEPIACDDAGEYIFGMVIVNDWSARDIQAWEYQPLGPFLGKSFATSISPWIVSLDALEPYRVEGPHREPQPLPYLRCEQSWNYDIALDVLLQTQAMRDAGEPAECVAHSNYRSMYWNMAQQLAHATINGTAVRPGDLYASGTISGAEPGSYGSFIELTWRGAKPLHLKSGEERAFLRDGDTVTLRAQAFRENLPRIGFGEVSGTILPARDYVAAGSSAQERK